MKAWLKLIPADERKTYERAGFLSNIEIGLKPCLIVVDVTYGFTGSEGLTLEEALPSSTRPADQRDGRRCRGSCALSNCSGN